jgi:hypothetical protein
MDTKEIEELEFMHFRLVVRLRSVELHMDVAVLDGPSGMSKKSPVQSVLES